MNHLPAMFIIINMVFFFFPRHDCTAEQKEIAGSLEVAHTPTALLRIRPQYSARASCGW